MVVQASLHAREFTGAENKRPLKPLKALLFDWRNTFLPLRDFISDWPPHMTGYGERALSTAFELPSDPGLEVFSCDPEVSKPHSVEQSDSIGDTENSIQDTHNHQQYVRTSNEDME
jgi:hypothetical protein